MADIYNHTDKLFANGEVDIDNLKVVLTSGYSFAAGETTTTNALAAEVSGNGWTAGGEPIASESVTIAGTNKFKLDGDNVSKTATGGDIGPADGYVIVDGTNNYPLFHESFTAKTANDGTPFQVNFSADGIYTSVPG